MKKWLFYVLALAAIPVLGFGGFGGEDVGKLRPVQVVMIRNLNGGLCLLTDTEDIGNGRDAHQAITDMKQTAPANVFLDTADYLLLEAGMEKWLPQLQDYLRPSCSLCYTIGNVDPVQAAEYLQLHEPELTLTQYEAGEYRLPYLISEEGRLRLVQP